MIARAVRAVKDELESVNEDDRLEQKECMTKMQICYLVGAMLIFYV